jgi:hypothetical protein
MAIILALLFLAMLFSRTARRLVVMLASVLGIYLMWDNLCTETDVGPAQIEVRQAEATLMGDPGISVPVRVKLQITNQARAELESVDIMVTLLDCEQAAGPCEPVGKKASRVQLLAPAGQSRRAESWVYFDNLPSIGGTLDANVRITGGVLDWS